MSTGFGDTLVTGYLGKASHGGGGGAGAGAGLDGMRKGEGP